jgi:hypothetical protein
MLCNFVQCVLMTVINGHCVISTEKLLRHCLFVSVKMEKGKNVFVIVAVSL